MSSPRGEGFAGRFRIRPHPAAWPIALVLILTWESVEAVPGVGPSWLSADKLAHFGVFGLLATAIVRIEQVRRLPGRGGWWAVALVSAYGAGTELLQSLVPYRSMEFDDWVADTLGAIVAVACYLCWTSYRCQLEKPFFRKRPGGLRPSKSEEGGVAVAAELAQDPEQ